MIYSTAKELQIQICCWLYVINDGGVDLLLSEGKSHDLLASEGRFVQGVGLTHFSHNWDRLTPNGINMPLFDINIQYRYIVNR